MFIEAIILGIVVALIRKGKFRNIEDVDISGWYLFLIAGFIQISTSLLKATNLKFGIEFFDKYFFYIHIITYLLLIIGVVLNIKKTFMKFILIGMVLNFIVIFSNGGQMPVSFGGIKNINNYIDMPDRQFDIKHTAVTKDTRFVYLADIILLTRPYPIPQILSIGDVFLSIGAYLFFQESMVRRKTMIERA